jgi:hypothetical protein
MDDQRRFSDRIGVTQRRTTLQVDAIDTPLQNSLWNFISLICLQGHLADGVGLAWEQIIRHIAWRFFKAEVDSVPLYSYDAATEWLHERYIRLQWFEVYNLIEFIVRDASVGLKTKSDTLANWVNHILEEEGSGYRFIEGHLVAISNATEAAAITDAINASESSGLDGVRIHLETAVEHLAKKPHPDYRNSIKESISAVESAARHIGKADSLRGALAAIEKKVPLHGALKAGFENLYGYTSDDDGIRHAILDSPTVGFDEAKFMLVSCSAFANFLISKAAAAGPLKRR